MQSRKLLALCAGVALAGSVGLASAQTLNSDDSPVVYRTPTGAVYVSPSVPSTPVVMSPDYTGIYSLPPTVSYVTPSGATEEVWVIAPPDLGPSDTVQLSKPDMSTVNNPRGTIYDPSDNNYSN